jgi:hypothetical protein
MYLQSKNRRIAPFILFVCVGVSACSTLTQQSTGVRIDILAEGPEPGPIEAEAVLCLESLTLLLEMEVEEPAETVRAIREYLNVHREEIEENARLIEARMMEMSADERHYYEEVVSGYFAVSVKGWADALDSFHQNYPQAALRIERLMARFD